MKTNKKFNQPTFWLEVAGDVYNTFANEVKPTLNGKILPELYLEVSQKVYDSTWNGMYHRDWMERKNDIWFSIHAQIHCAEDIQRPQITIFAILPFVGYSPFVMQLHLEPELQSQIDVFAPHTLIRYAERSESYSKEANAYGRKLHKCIIHSTYKAEHIEKKCIPAYRFFLGRLVAQNWMFFKTNNPKALTEPEQKEGVERKWAKAAMDSVFFGITITNEDDPYIVNIHTTCVGYEDVSLNTKQQEILVPLREELKNLYRLKMLG